MGKGSGAAGHGMCAARVVSLQEDEQGGVVYLMQMPGHGTPHNLESSDVASTSLWMIENINPVRS